MASSLKVSMGVVDCIHDVTLGFESMCRNGDAEMIGLKSSMISLVRLFRDSLSLSNIEWVRIP